MHQHSIAVHVHDVVTDWSYALGGFLVSMLNYSSYASMDESFMWGTVYNYYELVIVIAPTLIEYMNVCISLSLIKATLKMFAFRSSKGGSYTFLLSLVNHCFHTTLSNTHIHPHTRTCRTSTSHSLLQLWTNPPCLGEYYLTCIYTPLHPTMTGTSIFGVILIITLGACTVHVGTNLYYVIKVDCIE